MATPLYIKTGVQFVDYITVQDGTGAFITGLTNASFTKQLTKTGTGNQSTTGITIAEVDATNNPGVYSVTLANTSFLTANGSYHLKIYRTSDPTFAYEQIYEVTADGTPAGTSPLTFTSSSSNGRITDGAAAISGATVYVTQSSSNYFNSFTTDSNGNWGVFYQAASAGTFVITAFKSGYAQATSSLLVGASSITGPGADIALSAVSTVNGVSASDLWSYARRMANNKPGTQADTKIKQLVNDALDRFAKEHSWNWYWRRGQLAINGAYTTGTATLTNGSANVTISGGTWPTWAASAKLFINSKLLDVSSRTDGTTIVLGGVWNGTTASYSFTIFQDTYSLSSNFFEFGRVMQGQAWPYQPDPVSIQTFWENQNAWTFGSQYAWLFAISNGKISVGPYPNASTSVMYTYRARPTPLTSEGEIADVDPAAIETLRHLINYYVCLYFGECVAGTAEQCMALYKESLATHIANDKSPTQGAIAGGRRPGNLPMWQTKTTPFP